MAFENNNKLARGRPKGSLNQRSLDFQQVLEKHKFNAAEALIEIYKTSKQIYDSYATIYAEFERQRILDGNPYPTEDKADKYLKIAGDMAKELAKYSYPQMKAVEQIKINPLDNMSPEEKLTAMKEAVKMLEMQTKANKDGS